MESIPLAGAESPYPDAGSTCRFEPGMGINFDVNLFGVPGLGSKWIEEGFVVGTDGLVVLSKLVSAMRERLLREG